MLSHVAGHSRYFLSTNPQQTLPYTGPRRAHPLLVPPVPPVLVLLLLPSLLDLVHGLATLLGLLAALLEAVGLEAALAAALVDGLAVHQVELVLLHRGHHLLITVSHTNHRAPI